MARYKDLLVTNTTGSVATKVRENWTIEEGFPLPVFDVRCAFCAVAGLDDDNVQIRRWRFFRKGDVARPYRCDVDMKCRTCSVVWQYGVFINQEVFDAHFTPEQLAQFPTKIYDYKEGKRIIEGLPPTQTVEAILMPRMEVNELPKETLAALQQTIKEGSS